MSEGPIVVDHPIVQDALTVLRDHATRPPAFRAAVRRIALLVAAEATRDLPLGHREVVTPLETIDPAPVLDRPPVIVSILRAGNGMVDGVLDLLPDAAVGHIGLYRNERLEAVEYYLKLPPIDGRDVLVVDPMLATAGTAVAALDRLAGLGAASIRFLAVLAAPEGIARLIEHHPGVRIFVGAIDRQLNEKGYILPGLGDAGDRIFGTFV